MHVHKRCCKQVKPCKLAQYLVVLQLHISYLHAGLFAGGTEGLRAGVFDALDGGCMTTHLLMPVVS